MINDDHLGDDIELYALGMLEDDERSRVDAHAGGCRTCAGRLGRAEATVAQMLDATLTMSPAPDVVQARIPVAAPERRPARTSLRAAWGSATLWLATAAACLAIVSAAFAAQNARLRSDVADDGAAFHAMIDSHFSHAQFASPDGLPLTAKVVYERHGGWYEVLAHGIDPGARIVVVRGAVAADYPRGFARRDDVMTLALPALGAVSELRLLDSRGRTLGAVRPVLIPDPK